MQRPLARLAASLLSMLVVAACAGTAKPQVASAPKLPGEDPALRTVAAILRAEDRRVVDGALRAALSDADPRLRAKAVRAVARIAASGASADLVAALGDAEAPVRAEAAFGLGQLADSASLPRLLDAAKDPDPSVRAAAAEALGKIHDPSSADAMSALLDDGDPGVRAGARLACWKYADPSFALDRLIRTASSDPFLEFSAAYALARLSAAGLEPASSGAVPGRLQDADRGRVRERLVAFATSRVPEVRMQAARGLFKPVETRELRALQKLLTDPELGVRINAIRSLCFPGMAQETYLQSALDSGVAPLVVAATEGLGRVGTLAARDLLVKGMLKEPNLWIKETMFASLGKVDPEIAAGIANGMSKDPAPELRAVAARNVAGRTDEKAREIVDRLLADPDPLVAVAAVASRGGVDGPLSDVLKGAPASPDPAVRAAVARVVGLRLQRPRLTPEERDEALESIAQLWTRSVADKMPLAKLAVLEAAARAGKDARTRVLLVAGLDDADRLVRLKAIESLRSAFGEDHADRAGAASERPIEDYLEIVRWATQPRAAIVTLAREGSAPGRFTISLDTVNAPLASWNFAKLADQGFFDGLSVHRVVPNFVVQDGDPRGDGNGDPGYSIRDEFSRQRFLPGTVGMASDGPDTAGSQWFVTLSTQPHLDGRYTAFGHVVRSLDGVVNRVLPKDKVVKIRSYVGNGTEPLPQE